jgi:hypothetical protein
MYHQWGDEHHNHTTFAFHTSVPIEHIITSSFHDPSTLHSAGYIGPVHYVVVDASTSSVVVSLRGTMGFSDIVTVPILCTIFQ